MSDPSLHPTSKSGLLGARAWICTQPLPIYTLEGQVRALPGDLLVSSGKSPSGGIAVIALEDYGKLPVELVVMLSQSEYWLQHPFPLCTRELLVNSR